MDMSAVARATIVVQMTLVTHFLGYLPRDRAVLVEEPVRMRHLNTMTPITERLLTVAGPATILFIFGYRAVLGHDDPTVMRDKITMAAPTHRVIVARTTGPDISETMGILPVRAVYEGE